MTYAAEQRLTLVLLWHMHQPEYRDYASGEFRLPWVYLHALKDYADMAWHLENHPGVHAVVNFTPVLLEQLDDYAEQFKSGKLRDPLLRLLARPAGEPVADDERELILERCFPPEHADIAQPFAAYESLRALYGTLKAQELGSHHHLSDQYFYDLLVWHHLRWTGETVRRASPIVTRLMAIGTRFSHADRKALFDLIAEVVSGVLPRYAKLAASGGVEVSTTPHHHPLAPLLRPLRAIRAASAACARSSSLQSPRTRAASARRRPASGRPRAQSPRRFSSSSRRAAARGPRAARRCFATAIRTRAITGPTASTPAPGR
jgi:alpha-amylase/alpha-mannosidase (GH57 family)